MVSEEMLFEELGDSVGKIIIYFNHAGLRFEGKVLRIDEEWLKYFDTRKNKPRFVRLKEINEWEYKD